MNIDLLLALIFYLIIIIFYLRNKEKFQVQAKIFLLYRTKLGLNLMDKFAKKIPRFLKVLGVLSIVTGFIGMGFILYQITSGTIKLLLIPKAQPALAPVLPGIKIPGLPDLSFWHWIVAIFVIAAIHEFFHGVYSRVYNIKVKSSGFALFGPILGAFVEPDEKQLSKSSTVAQLSILSAGSFSNILLGVLIYFIFYSLTLPYTASLYQVDNLTVNAIADNSPFSRLEVKPPLTILKINDVNPMEYLDKIKPNENLDLETDEGKIRVKTTINPSNSSKGFIGIKDIKVNSSPKKNIIFRYGSFYPKAISWINLLVFWLLVVSVGIGLVNLLPLGPIDGGRMFYVAMLAIFKDKTKAFKIWHFVTLFCMFLIFINLLPYLWKFLVFISTILV